jgi:hypothetical protein
MKCKEVLTDLSPYVDEMLETFRAVQLSNHLNGCASCRAQYDRLLQLRRKLNGLGAVNAPPYLRHLVELRLQNARQDTWRTWLRETWEYRWSRIRTTERMWFLTRITGTVATCVLFMLISVAAMSPIYLQFNPPTRERGGLHPNVSQQLGLSVLKNLGLRPVEAQKRPISSSEPRINDLYLLNFSQSASRTSQDDNVSVVTVVDRSGAATVQDVLEYPADSELLSEFNTMIQSARYRPASQNGRAVDAHLVMTFSKISVYD